MSATVEAPSTANVLGDVPVHRVDLMAITYINGAVHVSTTPGFIAEIIAEHASAKVELSNGCFTTRHKDDLHSNRTSIFLKLRG